MGRGVSESDRPLINVRFRSPSRSFYRGLRELVFRRDQSLSEFFKQYAISEVEKNSEKLVSQSPENRVVRQIHHNQDGTKTTSIKRSAK